MATLQVAPELLVHLTATQGAVAVSAVDEAFPIDLSWAACPDVYGKNQLVAPNRAACARLCDQDSGCDAWQYCPEDVKACELANGKNSAGNWSRCYVSTTFSGRDRCLPSKAPWVGGARSARGVRVPFRSQPLRRKRGFSGFIGDSFTCGDAEALSLANSWFHTGSLHESENDTCRDVYQRWGSDLASEFVPTISDVGEAELLLTGRERERTHREWGRSNVQFLLGYTQLQNANITPADAANDWVNVQKLAALFDPPLLLVSPTVFAEHVDETGASWWLDEFLANCSDIVDCDVSLIGYIAFQDHFGSIDNLTDRIDKIQGKYGRGIWLTGFAVERLDQPPTRDEETDFMRAAIPILESHEGLHRYSWCTCRVKPTRWAKFANLLPWDSPSTEPTLTGLVYKTTSWDYEPEGKDEDASGLWFRVGLPLGASVLLLVAVAVRCLGRSLRSGRTSTSLAGELPHRRGDRRAPLLTD
eukprot:TRINITY_DN13379_c0_g2_i1.p1 TRINITY_DN13379_c0_g2~~TRINITY_DN13379_c0_g2_i1.p1  ORF type:complete len:510 (-),score=59.25 TRINITY_DN13379_c0_g2_i1:261-1682(-)